MCARDLNVVLPSHIANPNALVGATVSAFYGYLLHLELCAVQGQAILLYIAEHVARDDERVYVVVFLLQRLTAFDVLPSIGGGNLQGHLISPVTVRGICGSTEDSDVQAVAHIH